MTSLAVPCLRCRATTQVEGSPPALSCQACGFALPPPGVAAWMVGRGGGQPFGPYTLAQLATFIGQGQVLPTDSLWHQGATEWVPAGQLPALAVQTADRAPFPPAPSLAKSAPPPHVAPAPAGFAPPGKPHPGHGYGQPYPPAPAVAPAASAGAGLILKRAFSWDLRALPVEPAERQLLVANGVDDDNAGRFLVWRRSVLLTVAPVTLLTAILAVLATIGNEWSSLSALGVILELVRLAALFAMPVTAFLAAKIWFRHRRSRTVLLRGWLVAFLTPLILGLFPFVWRINTDGASASQLSQVNAALALVGAIAVYVTLMPAVLSLIPGVLRGCLRVKSLLPQSTLPGWFLVAATPLYVLLFLVVFTTINQVAGNLVLLFAVLAVLGAPTLYLFNSRTFTRPLRTPEEVAKVGQVQTVSLVLAGLGLLLLIVYAFTATLFGKSLIGLSEATSLIRPWNLSLWQFPIEYVARSLFTTVLVADLIMMMNLSLWRDDKAFGQVPESAEYDRMMSEIEEAGGTGRPAAG